MRPVTENDLIRRDMEHDLKFEAYLSLCGWKSKHKQADLYGSGNRNAHSANTTISTSPDTSGSFHGDNIRHNLFPDSTDRLDSFDLETDRLSLLSFRSANASNNGLYTRNQNNETYYFNTGREGGGNEQETDNAEEAAASVVENSDVDDDFHQKFLTSRLKCKMSDTLPAFSIRPLRPNDFEYEQTDRKPILRRESSVSSSTSKLLRDHGIPLNSFDTIENFDRAAADTELNYFNLDKVIESADPMFAVKNQPKDKFPLATVLEVAPLSQYKLKIPSLGRRGVSGYYRSNLSSVYKCNGYYILLVATGSRVNIFDLSHDYNGNKYENGNFLGWIDLSFTATDNGQIFEAIDTNEPYSINYLSIQTVTLPNNGKTDLLTVANDFSQVIVLELLEVLDSIFTKQNYSDFEHWGLLQKQANNRDKYIFEMHSKFNSNSYFQSRSSTFHTVLRLNSSAWCVRIEGMFIFVSDNSRCVSAFQIRERGCFYLNSSDSLTNNIPHIDAIERNNTIVLCCATYSGFQYILTFEPALSRFFVVDSIEVDSPLWSCTFVKSGNFLKVGSFNELTGDITCSNSTEIMKVLNKSEVLDTLSNPKVSSHLGLAVYFTHLKAPSISSRCYNSDSGNNMIIKDHVVQLTRQREIYDLWYINNQRYNEDNKNNKKVVSMSDIFYDETFIISSTIGSVGLFTLDQLLNLATCKDVFPIITAPEIVEREDNSHSIRTTLFNQSRYSFLNRIYLTCPMFSINAIALASQAGQVGIFRLTQFNGLHGLRLEWLLVDIEKYTLDQHGKVCSIIGLSATVIGKDNKGNDEWLLLVVFSDLLVFQYKICQNVEEENERLNIFNVI